MAGQGRRALLLGTALALCGCHRDADCLGRICHKIADKFDGATERMRGQMHAGVGAVRGSLGEASLDSRVALRLRWDKDMSGASVQVSAAGPGIVELHGTVADLRQRRRAVELASTTIGIDKVLDTLTVEDDAK